MGVSAVPGAGKTYILSLLAARLVATAIDDDQEVLIVTLVNSAVENIKNRVAGHIGQQGLLANVGYRVRTLHGLAHDIVREQPGLVGLDNDFRIVDERTAKQILEDVVDVWLRSHPGAADDFLSLDMPENQREWATHAQWPETVRSLAATLIKRSKDLRLSPEDLSALLTSHADDPAFALARMGAQIYVDYQKSLYYRGVVDFDDLIRLAFLALELDSQLLSRLRHHWPFILEDEAQDSSALQEDILRTLAGPNGNWVRVGDPNQAINTTFTTADPKYLRDFLQEPGVTCLPLNDSGRSQQHIIDLANALVEWTMAEHPEPLVRDALHGPPFIRPTPPDDPQPNPPADPSSIYVIDRRYSSDKEIDAVVRSLSRWLPDHPDDTVAVLVPRNQRGFQMTDALRRAKVPYVELLRSTTSTRKTAGALGNVLKYLANPTSASLLARVFEVWRRQDREEEPLAQRMRRLSTDIRRCRHVEAYLWPRAGLDWLEGWDDQESGQIGSDTAEPQAVNQPADEPADKPTNTLFAETHASFRSDRQMLETFRSLVRRWQEATVLPIDQLLLTIARDLFIEPGELALSHKLALMLRTKSEQNPDWRLPELTAELVLIAQNQRRFLGFEGEDSGFKPPAGVVTISTLHKAKGLEWDKVYLMSVNNYNFPSAQPYDEYISEKWFIRDRLNLEAEALDQIESLTSGEPYSQGHPTHRARLDYVAERLRLLYVGMTRAKKELVITWNTGRSREPKQMAVPLIALHTWRQQKLEGSRPM